MGKQTGEGGLIVSMAFIGFVAQITFHIRIITAATNTCQPPNLTDEGRAAETRQESKLGVLKWDHWKVIT